MIPEGVSASVRCVRRGAGRGGAPKSGKNIETMILSGNTLTHTGRCRGLQWEKWKRQKDQARHLSPELSSTRLPRLPGHPSTPWPCPRSCRSCSTPPPFGCMGCTWSATNEPNKEKWMFDLTLNGLLMSSAMERTNSVALSSESV